eukprot:XP_001695910.1 predicted protein [Chlamydomonas reinhardtii]
MAVEFNAAWKQYAVTADPVALRRLALRRALAAAYPLTGGAAASTEEDDAAAGAGAARSRLVDARGPTFALAAVISANGGPGGPGGGSAGGGGYITVAPLGGGATSPCGILLRELGLKPPKGQMRALFDTEPRIFQAGKPSPNYLISLVHEPLRRLATSHPEELAAAVELLPYGLTVKAAAALLKRAFPQAFQDRRPPGVFPVNAVVMAQQLPQLFQVVIAAPYSHAHYSALAHCLSVPQVGLGAKCYNGLPVLVMLYAPAVDGLKPAAVAAATACGAATAAMSNALAAARGLPATVYIFDAPAAGPQGGLDLMGSLRAVLEEPGVAKVVHGCEQVIPWVESAAGCFVSPLLDTKLEGVDPVSAQENAPELWQLPSNWQAALTTKYWDFALAVLQHASGADDYIWALKQPPSLNASTRFPPPPPLPQIHNAAH